MMLRALYDMAQRQGLLENPDYEKKKVDLYLRIDEQGTLLSIEATGDAVGRGQLIDVPRMPIRTQAIKSGLLFDNAKYVLGTGKAEDKVERLAQCVLAFSDEVKRAADATQDSSVQAVARFMDRLPEQRESLVNRYPFGGPTDWTGSENIAFRVGSCDTAVHLLPAVRSYFAAQRQACVATDSGARMACLVTGKQVVPARLHPAVKRIPNAQTAGAMMVSFNADAFVSQGLAEGANAPISRAAAEGYVTALNWLLERTPSRRYRYGVPIGDDAVLVFWTREDSQVTDWITNLLPDGPDRKSDQHAMERVVDDIEAAPWKGHVLDEENPFYAVTLSGHARVIVRDWFETTAAQVRRSLRQFFADLRLGQRSSDLPLPLLLSSLDTRAGKPPADLLRHLLRSAFCGSPLPRQLLLAALTRLRLPAEKNESLLLHRRCALIKAALLRSPLTKKWEVSVSLDESNRSIPYLLGRLFAVLEQLQEAAHGSSLNTTIRDRYFGAASTTPGLVFPRLLKLSVHHAAKAEGLGRVLERTKASIMAGLPATALPRLLTPEEQGLFAIGYYHQRDRRFEKQTTASSAEAA